jgi:hypothetical protein
VRIRVDPDQALRRFERDAAIACGAMAVIALLAERGRPEGAAGVLAGGALMALSYWAIKGGVDLVVDLAARARLTASAREPGGRATAWPRRRAEREGGTPCSAPALPARRRVGLAVKFFTRYALLAVGAYVMLTCFRVHAVGLLAGATTPFVAAVVQAVRLSRAPSHREHP